MRKKTHEEFVKEMTDKNPSVKIIGKYNGALTDVDCQCEKCDYIWKAKPEKSVRGTDCPKCNFSKGEKKIDEFLCTHDIANIPQKKFDDLVGIHGWKLSYDFYIPSFNVLIEYQGEQHYEPIKFGKTIEYGIKRLKTQQMNDSIKREYAKNNNMKLLEIPYWEFDNIEEILESRLLKQSA